VISGYFPRVLTRTDTGFASSPARASASSIVFGAGVDARRLHQLAALSPAHPECSKQMNSLIQTPRSLTWYETWSEYFWLDVL
jgi:hypothetical protein